MLFKSLSFVVAAVIKLHQFTGIRDLIEIHYKYFRNLLLVIFQFTLSDTFTVLVTSSPTVYLLEERYAYYKVRGGVDQTCF